MENEAAVTLCWCIILDVRVWHCSATHRFKMNLWWVHDWYMWQCSCFISITTVSIQDGHIHVLNGFYFSLQIWSTKIHTVYYESLGALSATVQFIGMKLCRLLCLFMQRATETAWRCMWRGRSGAESKEKEELLLLLQQPYWHKNRR